MNEIVSFNNPEFGEVRTINRDGEPWFVGKDVAERLGHKNQQRAIRDHVDPEDKGVTDLVTPGGIQQIVIINESGLYSLVLSSKLPTAKAFRRWITSEVIPSIRKTGKYAKSQDVPFEKAITCAQIINSCLPENKIYVLTILKHYFPELDNDGLSMKITELLGQLEETKKRSLLSYAEYLLYSQTHPPALLSETHYSVKPTPTLSGQNSEFQKELGADKKTEAERKQDARKNKMRERPARCMVGCNVPFDTKKLVDAVKESHFTESQIFVKVGCARSTFRNWMQGDTWPSTFYRNKLCDVLGLPRGFFSLDESEKS